MNNITLKLGPFGSLSIVVDISVNLCWNNPFKVNFLPLINKFSFFDSDGVMLLINVVCFVHSCDSLCVSLGFVHANKPFTWAKARCRVETKKKPLNASVGPSRTGRTRPCGPRRLKPFSFLFSFFLPFFPPSFFFFFFSFFSPSCLRQDNQSRGQSLFDVRVACLHVVLFFSCCRVRVWPDVLTDLPFLKRRCAPKSISSFFVAAAT